MKTFYLILVCHYKTILYTLIIFIIFEQNFSGLTQNTLSPHSYATGFKSWTHYLILFACPSWHVWMCMCLSRSFFVVVGADSRHSMHSTCCECGKSVN